MSLLSANSEHGIRSRFDFSNQNRLLFVKLTDSAVKAIENYIRKRNELNASPTIEFKGSEGHLSIPSLLDNSSRDFKFSVSDLSKTKSMRGRFDCIQQSCDSRDRILDRLGKMNMKLTIKANEDVYETTKNRINVAQQARQKNCTKIIKSNMGITKAKSKVNTLSGPNKVSTNATAVAAATAAAATLKTTNVARRKKFVENISKISIKERLIHLLALRPYKKPQILDRINKEGGVKPTVSITSILNEIATLKENTYILKRHMWNDVQDDWPFYSFSEKQLLKRRKPQNLTPPESDASGNSVNSANSQNSAPNSLGSGVSQDSGNSFGSSKTNSTSVSRVTTNSNVSSGVGTSFSNSPTSLHSNNDSTAKRFSNSLRPGYFVSNDGLMTKKPRISHFKKSNEFSNNAIDESYKISLLSPSQYQPPVEQNRSTTNLPLLMSSSESKKIASDDSSFQKQTPSTFINKSAQLSQSSNFKNPNDFTSLMKPPDMTTVTTQMPTPITKTASSSQYSSITSVATDRPKPVETEGKKVISLETFRSRNGNQNVPNQSIFEPCLSNSAAKNSTYRDKNQEPITKCHNSDSAIIVDQVYDSVQPPLPTSQPPLPPPPPPPPIRLPIRNVNHDYLIEYPNIKSDSQLLKYRNDFNDLFGEYNDLRKVLNKISDHFLHLKELTLKFEAGSNEYNEVINQISTDYEKYSDDENRRIRNRYDYLHNKLSHIKKLVVDYQNERQEQ